MTPTPVKYYMTGRDKMKGTKSGKTVYLPTFEIASNPMIRLSVTKCDQGKLVKKYMSDAGILFVINEEKALEDKFFEKKCSWVFVLYRMRPLS